MFKLDPKQTLSIPVPALNDLQKSLGCFDYGAKTNAIDLETVEHPYYASLGACENFQDELLGWAYDRQRECDPSNAPYYLDCLKDLANGRGSSDLQTKVVIAESSGEFGLNEIMKAYKFLGIEINTVEGDDHIIGTYRSRVESAPRQKDEARESLLVIAKHRGSAEIEKVAKDKKMSYNEALEFLNVSADTAIDSIEACAVAMVSSDLQFLHLNSPVAHSLTYLSLSMQINQELLKHFESLPTITQALFFHFEGLQHSWNPIAPDRSTMWQKHIIDFN